MCGSDEDPAEGPVVRLEYGAVGVDGVELEEGGLGEEAAGGSAVADRRGQPLARVIDHAKRRLRQVELPLPRAKRGDGLLGVVTHDAERERARVLAEHAHRIA